MRVHDLFLISFSDENSPNLAFSSCQNAITLEKPYNTALKVRFFDVRCLWLIESVFIKLSIGPGSLIWADDFVARWSFSLRDYCTWAGYPDYRFLQLNSATLQLNSSRLQLNSSVLQLNSSVTRMAAGANTKT